MSEYLQKHFGAKLFLSYLVIIVLGVVILFIVSSRCQPHSILSRVEAHAYQLDLRPVSPSPVAETLMKRLYGIGLTYCTCTRRSTGRPSISAICRRRRRKYFYFHI